MDETPTHLYIHLNFGATVTFGGIFKRAKFSWRKRGRTTGILGFLHNSSNITFQDVL
jgi:predicted SprT family Zn-dependent metalloprotease